MFGTRTVGRSIVFGLGYLAGSRAGRERYEQIVRAASVVARQLRQQLDEAPDDRAPRSSMSEPTRKLWDDSDITLGRG